MTSPRAPHERPPRAAATGGAAHDPFAGVDLDRLRRRRGTKWSSNAPGVLPAWVADSDTALCPAVVEALVATIDDDDLGYAHRGLPAEVLEAFAARMDVAFGWRPDPADGRVVTDVVHAFAWLVERCTEPGDGVVLQTPVYPPFLEVVEALGRRVVDRPLVRDGDGPWEIDLDALRDGVRDASMLVLVNPHNPTGRCFSEAELRALGELAVEHDVVVVADEIHAELTHPGHRHVPFASLDERFAARTITLTSVSKAFNLGGMRCAVAHFGSPELARRWDTIPAHLLGEVSVLSLVASAAAWRDGAPWLDDLRAALASRRDQLVAFVDDHLPALRWVPPEGTYLAWFDLSAYGLGDDPAAFFEERALVSLSHGPDFGPAGRGYARLNFATTEPVLAEILERLVTALDHR